MPTDMVNLQLVTILEEQPTIGTAPTLPFEQGGEAGTYHRVVSPSGAPGDPIPVVRTPTACDLGVPQAGDLTMRGEMNVVLSQLARAQKSGAALGDTVRSMIEGDIAAEKARRVARSRALPVRLMLPITLLLLPGMVLLLYAPSMLRIFEELSGTLS